MSETIIGPMRFDLMFWNVYADKPFYDDKIGIKQYQLQSAGYKGFCFSDYSRFEYNAFMKFRASTDTKIVEHYTENCFCSVVGEYLSRSFCLWTKNVDELTSLLKSLPARTITEVLKTPKRNSPYLNKKNVTGNNGTIFSYAPLEDPISVYAYAAFLKLTCKTN